MAEDIDVKVAVLEEQIRGLRAQHKAQSDETRTKLDSIDKKFESLFEVLNQSKGAYKVVLLGAGVMGAIGGMISKLASLMLVR